MTPSRYGVILILVTVFAVLAVAQRSRALHLGYTIERTQRERRCLAEENRDLLCKIGALSYRIEDEIERLNIALLKPVEMTKAATGEAPGALKRELRTARR